MIGFNFDEWSELYKRDPKLFEERRREVINTLIENAPAKYRNSMRLAQMECDAYRESMEPLDAAKAMLESANRKLIQIEGDLLRLQKSVNGPIE